MNNNVSASLKKFSLPAILILLGLALFVIGQNTEQPKGFVTATLLLTLSGVVMLIFSMGTNLAKVASIVGLVLGLGGIYIYYTVANDVITIDNAKAYDKEMDELIKQNLSDIKTAQIAFKDMNGTYAKDFDALKKFILEGKIKVAIKNGGVPNRPLTPEERAFIYGPKDNRALDFNMTEQEASKLAKSSNPPADLKGFVRDTILSSFYESSFGSESYRKRREKMGFPDFVVDSIFYIPGTGKKFTMTVMDSVEYNGVKIPTLMVEGIFVTKFKKEEKVYSFGSTNSPALSSNWD